MSTTYTLSAPRAPSPRSRFLASLSRLLELDKPLRSEAQLADIVRSQVSIDVPALMSVLGLDTSLLGEDWRSDQELTCQLGDAWLASLESALLAVPSAITPHATNFLINPLHPDANQLAIASVAAYPFDVRLFKLLERR